MKSFISVVVFYFLVLLTTAAFAQDEKKVIITGVRFAYPLVEKWIEGYKAANPGTNIIIESRSVTDPAKFDLLIEAYEPDKTQQDQREYLYLAQYALLPVANANSAFAAEFGEKGLTNELIKQVYFNDIYANKKEQKKVNSEYTIYTRLQKAGAPITFSKYFGYEQANIKGKAIAGADEHLIKALIKDTTGVSYSVPGLIYNLQTRKVQDGLTVIPVDTDGNGRVSKDEIFYESLDNVLEKLESGDLKNIPVASLHLSLAKSNTNEEALKFLQWVAKNGQESLAPFGFLKPEPKRFQQDKAKFDVAIN